MTALDTDRPPPAGVGDYLPQLDGLRAVAILLVFWGHLLPGSYRAHLHLGTWGVQLFFVLSGFLITRILLGCRAAIDEGRATPGSALRAFYVRRFLRILPLYYGVLLVYALIWPDHPGKKNLAWLFVHAQNWTAAAGVPGPESLGHFWSLAVEEQFYAVWPVFALAMGRAGGRVVAGAVIVVSTVCVVQWPGAPIPGAVAPFGALALGCLVSLVPDRRWTRVAAAVGVALVLAQATMSLPASFRALSAQWGVPLVAAGLVAWATQRPAVLAWALEPRLVRHLGRISYGVYVLHMPLAVGLHRVGLVPTGDLPAAATIAAVTLALAAASWHGFEAKVLRLRARAPYARRAPAGEGATAVQLSVG